MSYYKYKIEQVDNDQYLANEKTDELVYLIENIDANQEAFMVSSVGDGKKIKVKFSQVRDLSKNRQLTSLLI